VSESNWLDLLILSNLHSATQLKKQIMDFIRENRRSLVKQKSWDRVLREILTSSRRSWRQSSTNIPTKRGL
jgi:hypothetical protein